MAISWYPGHMVTARKEAAETMARTDVVIEILDARIPGASSNPMITQLRLHRQRPGLLVLNKSDLADPAVTPAWRTALSDRENTRVIAISSKRLADVARLIPLAATLAPHRDSPLKPLRLMVMGIPNVGKSTLINALVKRAVARVGDQPAVTRQQSRHDLGPAVEVIDTPGLMWPAITYPTDGLMLAASHGYRLQGGRADFQKAALALVHDYRSGALGRISLETPASRAAMIESARAT